MIPYKHGKSAINVEWVKYMYTNPARGILTKAWKHNFPMKFPMKFHAKYYNFIGKFIGSVIFIGNFNCKAKYHADNI